MQSIALQIANTYDRLALPEEKASYSSLSGPRSFGQNGMNMGTVWLKQPRINIVQGTITVATCQFPTSSNIDSNLGYALDQMRTAKARGADVAHFPEACLSGYAGIDMSSHQGFDWPRLAKAVRDVLALAGKLHLWVVLGSAHRLTKPNKPHNSLYIIDDEGRLIDRYDKRFCSGDASGMTGDLAHYSPGDHFSVFAIRGIRCGALICVDCRYPDSIARYKRRGVALVFHSFHSSHIEANDFAAREAIVGSENFGFNPATTLPASRSRPRCTLRPEATTFGLAAQTLQRHAVAGRVSLSGRTEW